jgi:hypothetical protein
VTKSLLSFNTTFIETYKSEGSRGKSGGNSGKRGVGGLEGYSGSV